MLILRDNIAVIGTAETILRAMFPPQHDAHVEAWRKWRFLHVHGVVDKNGIVLVGRNAGRKAETIVRY